jgi:beta-lactamase class D
VILFDVYNIKQSPIKSRQSHNAKETLRHAQQEATITVTANAKANANAKADAKTGIKTKACTYIQKKQKHIHHQKGELYETKTIFGNADIKTGTNTHHIA